MSFKAKLKFGSKEYDVLSCSFDFRRDVDHKGRPASIVYGGTIQLAIESTDDTTVLESMLNSKHKPVDGSITFFKRDEDNAKMKEITFKNAYVIAYAEQISSFGGEGMQQSFTISAHEVKIGNAQHINEWPDVK